MEVGVACEEPNVLELDGYGASRKVEIDFMNRSEVYRKRPRNWAKDMGIHVMPT